MSLSKDYETLCQQVWLEAWTKVASSDSCFGGNVPTTWADRCLRDFKKRFPQAGEANKLDN